MSWFGGGGSSSSSGSTDSSSGSFGSSGSSFDSFASAPPPPPPSFSSSAGGGGMSSSQMNAMALEQALLQEQERAQVTAAIAKLTEICFDKCVSYPDAKLSSSEISCIKNTTGRYLDASMFVVGRLMRQSGAGATDNSH
jgi:import inner membrane translocase subunit TIM8